MLNVEMQEEMLVEDVFVFNEKSKQQKVCKANNVD